MGKGWPGAFTPKGLGITREASFGSDDSFYQVPDLLALPRRPRLRIDHYLCSGRAANVPGHADR